MAGLAHSSGPLGQAVQGEEASQEKAPTVVCQLQWLVWNVWAIAKKWKHRKSCRKFGVVILSETSRTVIGSLEWSPVIKHQERLLEVWSGRPQWNINKSSRKFGVVALSKTSRKVTGSLEWSSSKKHQKKSCWKFGVVTLFRALSVLPAHVWWYDARSFFLWQLMIAVSSFCACGLGDEGGIFYK